MLKRALLSVLPILACVASAQKVDLHYRPALKTVHQHELKMTIEVGGFSVEFSATGETTVTAVSDKGDVSTEGKVLKGVLVMNGDQQEMPSQPATKWKRSSKNEILEAPDGPTNQLTEMSNIIRGPIITDDELKVGSKWTKKITKDEKKHVPTCDLSYEITGVEKVGETEVAVLKFTYKDGDGGKCEGTSKIRLSDGVTVGLEAKFEGVSPQEGAPAGNGTVKFKLISG